jgi:hypothetical protein
MSRYIMIDRMLVFIISTTSVIPAEAGIYVLSRVFIGNMDSRLRGNDVQ